jgi:hypothetical protein
LLQDDTVNGGIVAVPSKRRADPGIVDRRGEQVDCDVDADLTAERAHPADVREARFVLADHHDHQPGRDVTLAKNVDAAGESVAQLGCERATVEDPCGHARWLREERETDLETVRRETRIGENFSREAFEDAFAAFVRTYNVDPLRALGAPDVFARFCTVFAADTAAAHRHSTRASFRGIPLVAAILAPGTIVFEGEVDEERMGDW